VPERCHRASTQQSAGVLPAQSPKLKRALNKVIFDRLYLNEGRVEAHRLAPVVSELVQANRPAVVYEHRSNALVAAQALSVKHNSPVRVDRAKGRTASNARTAAFGGHGWSKTAMVELVGRYSKWTYWVQLTNTLQRHRSKRPRRLVKRAPVRKLSTEEVAVLLERYRSGATMIELAGQFKIHRTTVSAQLRRVGVKPRY
jgi:DNA-binding CsgD family transcriptional regulator